MEEDLENEYFYKNFCMEKEEDILNSLKEKGNEEEKEEGKKLISQKENLEENISTTTDKKIKDKKELRKEKNKESARKCRLKKKQEYNKLLEDNEKLKNELTNLRKKLENLLCSECKKNILNSHCENYSISSKNDYNEINEKNTFLKKKRNAIIFTSVTILFCILINFAFVPQKNISLRKLSSSIYSFNNIIKNFTYNQLTQKPLQGILIKNGNDEILGNISKMNQLFIIDLRELYKNEEKKIKQNKIFLMNEKLKKITLCLEFEPFWKDIDKEGESGIGMELISENISIDE
jgi:hypothetical protein